MKRKPFNESEVGSASGVLHNQNDTTHEFSKENECGYFMGPKSELCMLDMRICLYDTETYRICARYKDGMNRKIPGMNGEVPDKAPINSMQDIEPVDGTQVDQTKLYKN